MKRVLVLAAAVAVVFGMAMVFTWLYCTTAEQMSGRAATPIDYAVGVLVLTVFGLAFISPLFDMEEV